jgi:hypothetical protein
MAIEKALFASPFLNIALIERNGKWSAEIGNKVYYWNCETREEAIQKTMERVIEINEDQTKLFFQEHFYHC